jgi:hypothetical protein
MDGSDPAGFRIARGDRERMKMYSVPISTVNLPDCGQELKKSESTSQVCFILSLCIVARLTRFKHPQADSSSCNDANATEALLTQLGVEELDGLFGSMSQLMNKEVLYEPLKELHETVCSFAPY